MRNDRTLEDVDEMQRPPKSELSGLREWWRCREVKELQKDLNFRSTRRLSVRRSDERNAKLLDLFQNYRTSALGRSQSDGELYQLEEI